MNIESIQIESQIQKIFLNRPDKRNALSIALMEELTSALKSIPASTRIVILEGRGSFFCAGLDLSEAQNPALSQKSTQALLNLLTTLGTLPQVTIANVHGGAYAGGMGIMAVCDLVIASAETLFSLPELRRGLSAPIVHLLFKEQIPFRVLHELILTGEPITATRAHTVGLINHVVSQDERGKMCEHLCHTILKGAPETMAHYKKSLPFPLFDSKVHEELIALHQQMKESLEAKEGMAAFIEKRAPFWLKNL